MPDRPDGGNTIDDTHDTGADVGNAPTVAGRKEPAAPPSEALEGQMVGEYKVESRLGEGGMGTVYGAIHPVIGKRAAIKVIKRELCTSPDLVERFVGEARAVNQIGHPNIVDIFSFGTLGDGRSYFVMEWLRGESLAARMRRGRLPFGDVLDVLEGVLHGLEAAHGSGIVHRDLKPDNVYLVEVRGQRPQVKLLDFGIAKLTAGEDNRIERTRSGVLMGTPRYIAPEQARGQAVDFRVDVYSLGVMAFELFTGKAPFDAATAMDLIAKHLNEAPPRASSVAPVPAALDRLLHEMLDKEAANRPDLARVRAVLEELRTAVVDRALLGTVPEADLPHGLRTARKRKRAVGAIALASLVLVAGGAVAVYELRGGDGAAETVAVAAPDAGAVAVAIPDAGAVAAAVPDAVAETGTLVIHVIGGPATAILVDHQVVKNATVAVAAGKHQIEVDAKGRRPAYETVDVKPGVTVEPEISVGPLLVKPGKPRGGGDDDNNVVSPFGRKPK